MSETPFTDLIREIAREELATALGPVGAGNLRSDVDRLNAELSLDQLKPPVDQLDGLECRDSPGLIHIRLVAKRPVRVVVDGAGNVDLFIDPLSESHA